MLLGAPGKGVYAHAPAVILSRDFKILDVIVGLYYIVKVAIIFEKHRLAKDRHCGFAMRITQNQTPIIIAIFAAFALAALPDPSHAQAPPPIGTFNAQNCYSQMQNSYTNTQQAHTVMQQKVITNGPIPSFKIVYCWNSIIQPLINSISSLTTLFSANGAGTVASAIDALLSSLLNQIVIQLINTLCGIITSAVQSAIAMLKSWMCIPIPHFNLNLNFGSFSQIIGSNHNCSGMNLMNLAGVAAGGRVVVPSVFQMWNMNGQY